jgi:16S rRNA (uracil1498-N3)-methyltransferase
VTHAVPLGVSALDFVACERSGRAGALGQERLERLTRIARAALKQSRRSRLPALGSSASLEAAVRALDAGERLFADPEGKPFTPHQPKNPQAAIQLAVGPPGGFTDGERRVLLAQGFSPIYLGPSRLTTETAALALISLARNSL